MGERFNTRAVVVAQALARSVFRKAGEGPVRRVLVAHNLLLGDTLMLTPLLAKLRERHPAAQVHLLAAPAVVPLYAGHPYGVRALAFAPSRAATTRGLMAQPAYDLAFVAGDNRYSWLAAALGARHIVAHTGGPARSNWFVDEARPYPDEPAAWGDMVAALLDGGDPAPYGRGDWPDPPAAPFDLPTAPYAVLHVGASTPLKRWLPERWNALARALSDEGLRVVWSAGRGEEAIVAECDPGRDFSSYAGQLDLPQLWRLLRGAALAVAPDTGVSHLGRAAWTPTVTLFGPGSRVLCDSGRFWRDTPWLGIGEETFPCRDQQRLFHRDVAWVRRCARSVAECPEPRCMHAISVEAALAATRAVRAAGHPRKGSAR
jgi:ADP-heptose:LPS heptosyltransferase